MKYARRSFIFNETGSMAKPLLLILIMVIFIKVNYAQRVIDVINAEKSFAAYAVKYNPRDAFLQFLDSNAVVFEKGKAVNAKER